MTVYVLNISYDGKISWTWVYNDRNTAFEAYDKEVAEHLDCGTTAKLVGRVKNGWDKTAYDTKVATFKKLWNGYKTPTKTEIRLSIRTLNEKVYKN